MKRQIFILSLSIIVLIVIGAIFWCRLERKRHIDIDSQQYPVAGIDVSAHNGNIDFNKVSKISPISFPLYPNDKTSSPLISRSEIL